MVKFLLTITKISVNDEVETISKFFESRAELEKFAEDNYSIYLLGNNKLGFTREKGNIYYWCRVEEFQSRIKKKYVASYIMSREFESSEVDAQRESTLNSIKYLLGRYRSLLNNKDSIKDLKDEFIKKETKVIDSYTEDNVELICFEDDNK